MSGDLATLVLTVESSSAERGVSTLDRLTRASVVAEKSVDSLSKATRRLEQEMSRMSRVSGSIGVISKASSEAQRSMSAAASASARNGESMARATSSAAKESARYAREMERLRASIDPAYAAARRMEQELQNLADAERRGIQVSGGYESALSRIIKKYDETGRAAEKAAKAEQAATSRGSAAAERAAKNHRAAEARSAANAEREAALQAKTADKAAAAADRQAQRAAKLEQASVARATAAAEKAAQQQEKIAARAASAAQRQAEKTARAEKTALDRSMAAAERATAQQTKAADRAAAAATKAASRQMAEEERIAAQQSRAATRLQAAADKEAARTGRRQDRKNTLAGNAVDRAVIEAIRDEGREMSRLSKEAAVLLETVNPLAAAQDRLAEATDRANRMQSLGLLSQNDTTTAIRNANKEYDNTVKKLNEVAASTHLGGNQMQNLGYQVNDAATMLASGSSVYQVVATQAGQVVQALGDNPNGIKGTMKALAAQAALVATGMGPVGIAFAAAAAAAVTLAFVFRRNMPDMEETLKKQGTLVDQLSDKYIGLGESIAHMSKVQITPGFEIKGGTIKRDIEKLMKDEFINLDIDFTTYLGQVVEGMFDRRDASTSSEFSGISNEVNMLRTSLKASAPDIEKFRRQLEAAYGVAMKNGNVDDQKAIEKAFRMTETLSELTGKLAETRKALELAQPDQVRLNALPKQFGDSMDALRDSGPPLTGTVEGIEAAFKKATSAAMSMGQQIQANEAHARALEEALRPSREALEDAQNALSNFRMSPEDSSRAEIDQKYQREISSLKKMRASEEELANKRDEWHAVRMRNEEEIARTERVRLANHQLELKSIGARGAVQAAALAAERARLDAEAAGYGEVVQAQRKREAVELSLAQSQEEAIQVQRQRNLANADGVESIKNEIEAMGKSAGQVAELNTRYQLLKEYKEQAYQEGRSDLTQSETDAIEGQAKAVGLLTEQLARLNMVREQESDLRRLQVEASVAGRSDDYTRQALAVSDMQEKLRQQGEDLNSSFARGQVANAVALSDYGDAIRRQSEAWADLKQAGESTIDTLVSGLIDGTASMTDVLKSAVDDIGKTILQLGLINPLKNDLLGTSLGTLGDLFKETATPGLSTAGASSVSAMNVTAAVVNLSGAGGAGGLLGAVTGSGKSEGAVSAIDRLLTGSASGKLGADGLVPVDQVTAYIRQAASMRGIDPDIAVRVAKSEGLGPGIWQSNFTKNGMREPSYGPFQLLKGGKGTGFGRGMGNDFQSATGLDPADPKNTFAGIDYALDGASKNGWGAWYGAGKAGIGNREGIGGITLAPAEDSLKGINDSAGRMQRSASSSMTALTDSTTSLADGLGGTFSSLDQEMLRISSDFTPAFDSSLQSVLDTFTKSLGKGLGSGWESVLAGSITGGMTGAAGGGDAWAGLRLAGGGAVTGPGTSRSDSIPAMLSDGEFVVNAEAASRSRPFLEALNEGRLRHYSSGGHVTARPMPASASSAPRAPSMITNIIDQRGSGQKIETKERTDEDGNRVLDHYIRDTVDDQVSRPGSRTNKRLQDDFGLQRPVVRR